jgi:hypothetical protein
MAVDFVNDATDIDVGIAEQTVDAETFEQAPFERLLNTGATADYPSNEVVSEDVGDTGGPTGRRRIARGGNVDIPMHARYGAARTPIAGAFRDDFDTELTVVGSGAPGDLEILIAGTHSDGSTGLQIKAPLNALSALKAGAGRGLLVRVSGFAAGDNNQPFMVKDVHDDTVDDLIDIYAGYGAGGVGAVFGATKANADSQSATLRFGLWVKNRRKGAATKRHYSVLFDRYQLTGARRYRGLVDWVPNDFSFEIPDEGAVRLNVTGMGRRWLASQATPPNGEAEGDHFTDPTLRDFVVGGEDLQLLALVPYANALSVDESPIVLSDKNVTNFTFNLVGGVTTLANILGSSGVVPKRGRFEFNQSLGYYVADDAVITRLEALGAAATHQKAAMHCLIVDPDGNAIGLTTPRNEFAQTGGEAGGSGEESGTLEFGAEAIDHLFRTAVWQEWAAA